MSSSTIHDAGARKVKCACTEFAAASAASRAEPATNDCLTIDFGMRNPRADAAAEDSSGAARATRNGFAPGRAWRHAGSSFFAAWLRASFSGRVLRYEHRQARRVDSDRLDLPDRRRARAVRRGRQDTGPSAGWSTARGRVPHGPASLFGPRLRRIARLVQPVVGHRLSARRSALPAGARADDAHAGRGGQSRRHARR